MPIIDEDRDVLVLRVVYDGPPFSGKTTTLRTLSQGLGVDIVTPQEQNGRTLAFDWLDYTGGLFDGRKIRCQIVSVPGQAALARRRRYLLESADAVVVVADTRRVEIDATFEVLRDVLSWSRTQDPPVGVVLQANKRDHAQALPSEELHAGLAAIAPIGLIETVATSGRGVREAFVFAVRLALDRVRALTDAGTIPRGRPDVDSPEQLLQGIDRADRPRFVAPLIADSIFVPPKLADPLEIDPADKPPAEMAQVDAPPVETAPVDATPVETAPVDAPPVDAPPVDAPPVDASAVDAPPSIDPPPPFEAPQRFDEIPAISFAVGHIDRRRRWEIEDEPVFVPDPTIPGGFIWPPVDGRTLLDEATRYAIRPQRTPEGDWDSGPGEYRLHSSRASLFDDVEGGRAALIRWARVHSARIGTLSSRRVLVLAEAGGGRHRLWQVVRQEPTLHDRLTHAASEADPGPLAQELADAISHLQSARERLHHPRLPLRVTLHTLGADMKDLPLYVDLVPEVADDDCDDELEGDDLITRELLPLLEGMSANRSDYPEIVRAIERIAEFGGPLPGLPTLVWLARSL